MVEIIYSWNLENLKEHFRTHDEALNLLSSNNKLVSSNNSSVLLIATHALSTATIVENRSNTKLLEFLIEKLKEVSPDTFKDEIDRTNEIGNSALMIAAEFGHVEAVRMLHKAGASLNLCQKKYKHTALILACENNHLKVVRYILEEEKSQLEIANKYDKSALLQAVEFGSYETAKLLIDEFEARVDTNSRNRPCLMYACFNTKAHRDILDLLLEKGADVDAGPKEEEYYERPIHWAAQHGSAHAVDRFMETGRRDKVRINKFNGVKKGFETPLMIAAKGGHREVAKKLIDNGAKRWIKKKTSGIEEEREHFSFDDGHNKGFTNAFYLAIGYGHIELATECFMVQRVENSDGNGKYKDYSMLYRNVDDLFSSKQLQMMSTVYFRPDRLEILMKLAARYELHFQLFMKLFHSFPSLNSVLNVGLKLYMKTLRNQKLKLRGDNLGQEYELERAAVSINPTTTDAGWNDSEWDKMLSSNDVYLIYHLTMILSTINSTKISHPLEVLELQQYYDSLNQMVDQVFECACMSDSSYVEDSLCYHLDAQLSLHGKNFVDPHIRLSYAFREGPIALSLQTNTTALFSSGQISIFVDNIFYSYLRRGLFDKNQPYFKSTIDGVLWPCFNAVFGYNLLKTHDKEILSMSYSKARSNLIFFRYNPSMMFFGEGLSRAFTLFLTAAICLQDAQLIFGGKEYVEYVLIIMTISSVLAEYGELLSGGVSDNHRFIPKLFQFRYYFMDTWNQLDFVAYVLLILWCFMFTSTDETLTDAASICISISAIFMSFGILRYFTVFESIGKLTIMLFAMGADLTAFAFVFLVCMLGFAITLFGLLHGSNFNDSCEDNPLDQCDPYFSNKWTTFVTLFSATLGNFDLELLNSDSSVRTRIADVVLLLFLVVFTITLLSLIVARMSSSHDKIDKNAFQEWQFSKARFTQDYLLIDEKNPLCMMPAPFNMICVLLLPFHSMELWNKERRLEGREAFTTLPYPFSLLTMMLHPCCNALRKEEKISPGGEYTQIDALHDETPVLSICGTASDKVLGVIMSFIAPVVEFIKVAMNLINMNGASFRVTVILLYLSIAQVVIYPLYVINLLRLVLNKEFKTEINIIPKNKNEKEYLINFPMQNDFEPAPKSDDEYYETKPYLLINVISAKLDSADVKNKDVRPTLKFILGSLETQLRQSTNTTGLLLWSEKYLKLPIEDLRHLKTNLRVRLLDDKNTVLAKGRLDTKKLRSLITNNRLEGEIELYDHYDHVGQTEKVVGHVSIVLKAFNLGQMGESLWDSGTPGEGEVNFLSQMNDEDPETLSKRLVRGEPSGKKEALENMRDMLDENFLKDTSLSRQATHLKTLLFPEDDIYSIFAPIIPRPTQQHMLADITEKLKKAQEELQYFRLLKKS